MRLMPLVLGLVLLCGACSDDAGSTGSTDVTLGAGIGPGISVTEARRSKLDGPLLVRGFVVIEGARARLCETLRESQPPQCGGASLDIRGLDERAIGSLESGEGTRWTPAPVMLLGEVQGGALTVDPKSKAAAASSPEA